MALLHKATLTPPKLTLLSDWLPGRPWFTGNGDLEQVGAYRFDDPAGAVGLEAFLVRTVSGTVLHVPLTYRAAPLPGAEEHLVGTAEHSVLGTRWVYDGCADPVWVSAMATAVLTGGTQAEQYFEVDGRRVPRAGTATVWGSGAAGTPVPDLGAVQCSDEGPVTVVRADPLEVLVVRAVGADPSVSLTLTGTWETGGPAVLAGVRHGAGGAAQ